MKETNALRRHAHWLVQVKMNATKTSQQNTIHTRQDNNQGVRTPNCAQ